MITLKEQYLYGSKRLGVRKPHVQLAAAPHGAGGYGTMPILNFEFVILNRRAFGSHLPGRTYVAPTGAGYRFGFNGMQRDDEIKGPGNSLDFGARMYDSRLGRWMSVDPEAIEFPNHSPYAFGLNSPMLFNDPDGKKAKVTVNKNEGGGGTITVSSTIYISGLDPKQQDLIQKLNTEVKSLLKPGTYLDSEGQTWTIMYDITYKTGSIGTTSEDKNFNNQINVTNIKNNANSYLGVANVSKRAVKDAVEGKKQAIATILEETVHLLGYGDKYDTYWNPDGSLYGALAKSGYEQDIATGPARAENFEFTRGNYESLGCFLESNGGLSQSGTIRLQAKFDQNSIEKKQVTDLTPKQRDKVTQAPR